MVSLEMLKKQLSYSVQQLTISPIVIWYVLIFCMFMLYLANSFGDY